MHTYSSVRLDRMIPRSFAYPGGKARPAPSISQVGVLRHLIPAQQAVCSAETSYRIALRAHVENIDNAEAKKSALNARKTLIEAENEMEHWLWIAFQKRILSVDYDDDGEVKNIVRKAEGRNFNRLGSVQSCIFDSFNDDLLHMQRQIEAEKLDAAKQEIEGDPEAEAIIMLAKSFDGGLTIKNLRTAHKAVVSSRGSL